MLGLLASLQWLVRMECGRVVSYARCLQSTRIPNHPYRIPFSPVIAVTLAAPACFERVHSLHKRNRTFRESSTQWDKGFMRYEEFHYNIYIHNNWMWCYYESFETQRLICRSLACVEWRKQWILMSKSYWKCSTLAHLLFTSGIV